MVDMFPLNCILYYAVYIVDLVIFASFFFYGEFREEHKFTNSRITQKNIFIIALLKKDENSRFFNFVKNPKTRNSCKFEHAKITRSTVDFFKYVSDQ